jgi:hypothetical protein
MSMQQERKMMSLEEVEAALMNINGGRPIYSEAMIAEQQARQAKLEQRRAERLAKQADIVSSFRIPTTTALDYYMREGTVI